MNSRQIVNLFEESKKMLEESQAKMKEAYNDIASSEATIKRLQKNIDLNKSRIHEYRDNIASATTTISTLRPLYAEAFNKEKKRMKILSKMEGLQKQLNSLTEWSNIK